MGCSGLQGKHSPQCLEPGFDTKYTIPVMTKYWTLAAGVPGGCANHYTTAPLLLLLLWIQNTSISISIPSTMNTHVYRAILEARAGGDFMAVPLIKPNVH